MANYDIQLRQRNGSSYDSLFPQSKDTLITNSNTGSSHGIIGSATTLAQVCAALENGIGQRDIIITTSGGYVSRLSKGGDDYNLMSVSGVNDGLVWTKITINGVERNIPAPASGTVTSVNNISPVSGNVTIYGTNINRASNNSQTVDAGITQAKDRADEAYSLAQGRSRAFVYADVAATWTAISTQATYSQYNIGDNIYITTRSIPDMWYMGVSYSGTDTTTVNSQATLQSWLESTTATVAKVSIQAGFFYYAKLESQKVSTGVQSVSGDGGAISASGTTSVTVSHNSGDGYHHIPATGTTHNGNILVAGSTAGSESWTSPANITVGKATKLETARTFTVKVNNGVADASGTASFDGSAAPTISVTLANSGITAGTYSALTVNAKGIATAGAQMLKLSAASGGVPSDLADGGLWLATL